MEEPAATAYVAYRINLTKLSKSMMSNPLLSDNKNEPIKLFNNEAVEIDKAEITYCPLDKATDLAILNVNNGRCQYKRGGLIAWMKNRRLPLLEEHLISNSSGHSSTSSVNPNTPEWKQYRRARC